MVGKVPHQVIIQEFGTIVAVEALQGKGKSDFNILDLYQRALSDIVPGGTVLRPSGEDIRHGQLPGEVTG
mgnify:CR=1 FL=1